MTTEGGIGVALGILYRIECWSKSLRFKALLMQLEGRWVMMDNEYNDGCAHSPSADIAHARKVTCTQYLYSFKPHHVFVFELENLFSSSGHCSHACGFNCLLLLAMHTLEWTLIVTNSFRFCDLCSLGCWHTAAHWSRLKCWHWTLLLLGYGMLEVSNWGHDVRCCITAGSIFQLLNELNCLGIKKVSQSAQSAVWSV